MVLNWFLNAPRRTLALMAAACIALLGFGIYLQLMKGLEPCPMCIVQRYAMILVAIMAGGSAIFRSRRVHVVGALGALGFAGFGAFVAARQTWLQWYPPEVASCGRDFYGMIETFPLRRAIPMIFRGTGDCSKVDWTFLGGSIANWAFIVFCLMAVTCVLLLVRLLGRRTAG